MKQILILITLNVVSTLCFSQEYAQVYRYEVNKGYQDEILKNQNTILKNESTFERVENMFSSELNFTNQRLENIASNNNSNLSVIDVLSTNEFIDIDEGISTINMKDKNEIVLFINEVRMHLSNFQMYKILKNMNACKVKSVEIINVPEYNSKFSRNTGIIKIRNY